MVQNMHDICKLITSSVYQIKYNPTANHSKGKKGSSFNLVNQKNSLDYIHIEICKNVMEISKFKNMNSEFYESISTTTKRGKDIYDLIMSKRFVAMCADIEENYR